MDATIAGSAASSMPSLDIAEQKSWQNFLDSALRLYATLNRSLSEIHHLALNDVRLLDILNRSATGAERMGDLAEALMSLPSRVTRQMHRLEKLNLAHRVASPDDGRGVLAMITDEGRAQLQAAMSTYCQEVRTYYVAPLSRAQMTGLGENCRRISSAIRAEDPPARLGRGQTL